MKPGVGSTIDFEHPLARGLVGCWLMNEGGGSKTIDMARANHGTITGPTRVPEGLSFDGTNDYVALPASSNLLLNQTIVLRCYVAALKSWNVLVSAGGGTNFWIGIDVSGNLRIGWRNAAGTGKASTIGLGATTNTWMHLAFRIFVDGSNVDLSIYKDGAFANSVTAVDGFFADRYTRIGNASVYYLQGAMSGVTYYDRALSANEISLLSKTPYAFIDSSEDDLGFVLGGLNLTLVVSDSFGLADAPSKSDAKSISDSVNVLDARKLAFLKSVADNFTLSDSSNRVLVIVLQLADAFSLSSSEKRAVTKTVTELLALNDLSMKLAGKPFADSFGTGDAFTKRFTKGLQELFTLNDLMVKSTGKSLLDTLTLADLVGIVGGSGRPGLIHGMLSVDWEPRLMSLEWEGRNLTVHWTN